MARYVQQISLVPFSTTEMWVGWDLEGIEGDVEGLVPASAMTDIDLARIGVYEFQHIPAAYVTDLKLEIMKKATPDATEAAKHQVRGRDVSSQRRDS